MSEVGTVFKMASRNWLFREDYNWANGTYKEAGDDKEIAIVRQYLLGDTADVRLSAKEANAAVSMVQALEQSATTIHNNLTLMEELAQKAANGYYTNTDKASMQEQLKELANGINNIVDGTEYDGNKLFTNKGQVITISIGKERTIHLSTKDLGFDVENADLTKNAKGTLASIKEALKQTSEYTAYLKSQNKVLRDAMTTIENQMASAVGIEPGNFKTEITEQFIANIRAEISDDKDTFIEMQSNITADEALQLLKD